MIFFVVAGAMFVVVIRRRRTLRDRRARAVVDDLPDAIDLLLAALRAGHTPVLAIELLACHAPLSVRDAFRSVLEAMNSGERLAIALNHVTRTLGPIARPLTDILADGDRLGIPIDQIAYQLSIAARHHRRRQAEASARKLPVQLAVPLVVCTLPSFVVLVIVPVIAATLGHIRVPTS
ncbi:MAG: putative type secretion system protein [Actinomycetota bacterium]